MPSPNPSPKPWERNWNSPASSSPASGPWDKFAPASEGDPAAAELAKSGLSASPAGQPPIQQSGGDLEKLSPSGLGAQLGLPSTDLTSEPKLHIPILSSLAEMPGQGASQALKGAARIAGAATVPRGRPQPSPSEVRENRIGGTNDILEGAGRAAAPFVLPAAAVANPVGLAAGMAIGYGTQKAGEKVASAVGASPETQRLVGNVSGLVAGPLAAKGMGAVVKAPGKMFGRSALGLKGAGEAYGGNPTRALMEETKGVQPQTILKSAEARKTQLVGQRDQAAQAATSPADLRPAREVISLAQQKAAAGNSLDAPERLQPMLDQLTVARPGFRGQTSTRPPILFDPRGQPISESSINPDAMGVSPLQSVPDALRMRSQFDQDHIRNWNPLTSSRGQLGVARQAYRGLTDAIHSAAPETAPLDLGIHSIVPVAQAAKAASMSAGPGERMLSRVARPTGGLAPVIFGLHAGGLEGGLAALGLTEGLTSPVAKMIAARSLYGLGKGIQSPSGMAGAASAPLILRPQQ